MRAVGLVLLLLASPAAAQPWRLPSAPPPVFDGRPLHASASRAYAYSAAATLGGAALGYGLYLVWPDPSGEGSTPIGAGLGVAATAVLFGPSLGNITLGADRDAVTGLILRTGGIVGGVGILLGGALTCAAARSSSGDSCDGVIVAAGAVYVGLTVAGTAYDLATIPKNARLAAIERGGRPVTIAPTANGLAVRVPL